MKMILIARVSDEEQRKALVAQERRLKKYADDNNSEYEYHEFDESAFKDGRVKFTKLVDDIKKQCHKNKLIVVFDKIDRLTRDSSQAVVADMKSLVKQDKIELHFPHDNLTVDAYAPAQIWFQLDIGMSLAQYYARSTSDNVRRRFDQMLNDGFWPHKAPIGYKNVRRSKRSTTIKIDTERAPYIVKAFEMRAKGMPYQTIGKTLDNDGLRSSYKGSGIVCTANIERILKNPFYYGVMIHNGKEYGHKYPPIISKDLFDQCQDTNDSRGGGKATKYDSKWFTFKSIARCGKCKTRTMSPYQPVRGGPYLKCPLTGSERCVGSNVSERHILPPIERTIEAVIIPPHFVPKVIQALKSNHDTHNKYRKHNLTQTRTQHTRIGKTIERNYMSYIKGSITEELYEAAAKTLEREKSQLNATLRLLSNTDEGLEITESYLLSLATQMSELFKCSKPELRQRLLTVLVSNIEITNKNITFDVNDPFKTMMEIKKSDPEGTDSSTWRRRGDSNPRSRSLRTNDLANRPLKPLGYPSNFTRQTSGFSHRAVRRSKFAETGCSFPMLQTTELNLQYCSTKQRPRVDFLG